MFRKKGSKGREKKTGYFPGQIFMTAVDKIAEGADKIAEGTNKMLDPFSKHAKDGDKDMDSTFRARADKARRDGAHRLRDIFAKPLNLEASFIPPVHPKSKEDFEFIAAALSDSLVFEHLRGREKRTLVDAFEPYDATRGENIIVQGDVGDFFYVVKEGKVAFIVDGKEAGTAEASDSFGELALLYDAPRAATCTAVTDVKLWRVDQNTFRRIIAKYSIDKDDETKALLKNVAFLKDLDDKFLNKIACALSTMTFDAGAVVAEKGTEAKMFYIVKEGEVKVTDIEIGGSKYDDVVFGPGKYFGERGIVKNEPLVANVTATVETTLLRLSKEVFTRVLGDLSQAMTRSMDKKKLGVIPVANVPRRHLEDYELDALASKVVAINVSKDHVFFSEGKMTTPALYLVRSGKVSVQSSASPLLTEWIGVAVGVGETRIVTAGGYFGNDTLSPDEDGNCGKAKYTVTAVEDCTVGVLSLKDINSIIVRSKSNEIKFEDLQKYRILGAGTFGKVWLVSKKNTNEAYALKVQNKRQLIDFGQAAGVIREKNIMERLDHDFIIRLVNSYKDESAVYMLLKLYQGGEMHSIMHTDKRDTLPEWAARFYAGGILEGLSYMHHRHIIYRDLKPENVLLDSDGYTVIVDLGFAKVVPEKTYTFCGTPLYIAPEVVLQRGHDKGYDHWSWGVMLYEMLTGVTPFYEGNIDQMTLFKRIVKADFVFPSGDYMSSESKDLINQMLVPNPAERLGSFAGADADIRNHPWFFELDFEKLVKKEVRAPWVPKIKDPLDVGAFENWDHLEEEEEPPEKKKPLSKKEQKMFDNF